MPGPAISVVIAARNAATTIGEQLDALARQSIPAEWEIVLCDNGSTDDTRAIADAPRPGLPPLRIVDATEARSAGGARNIGVAAAGGSLIAFCDADDVVADDWLVEIANAMTDQDFVACTWEMSRLNPSRPEGVTMGPTFRLDTLPHLAFAGAGAMAVRREVFLRVDGFDTHLPIGEDTDLSWRLQLSGVTLAEAPKAIVHIRERDEVLATLRQWYRYGRAERQLQAKFADVHPPAVGDAPRDQAPTMDTARASIMRKVRRIGHLGSWRDVAPFLQRQSRRLGLRWGRVDHSVPPYRGPGSGRGGDTS